MKHYAKLAAVIILSALVGSWIGSTRIAHAQATTILQVSGAYSTHTSCVIVPSQTTACLASDGIWISLNGAAFTQVGAATSGVTSLNGKQGALTVTAIAAPPIITSSAPAPAVTVTVQ